MDSKNMKELALIKSKQALALAEGEKDVNKVLDAFYRGKVTDNADNMDVVEINAWMEMR